MNLSQLDRVMLANQYKILALLDSGSSDYYDTMREALEQGFESYYEEELFKAAYPETLSSEDSTLVIDAMSMYDALQNSYRRLDDQSGIEEDRLVFPGFDGNHETAHYSYARFVVEREQRFTGLRFEKDRDGDDTPPAILDRFNSHSPTLDFYRARISAWKALPNRYDLSREEILSILETRA